MTKQSVTIITKLHSVGSFTFDATYFEQHTGSVTVTKQPVEFGASIPDHAFVEPLMLTISGGVGDTAFVPNPSFDASSSASRSASAYQKLLLTMNNRELLTVQTGLAGYSNMLIVNLNTVQDAETANIFNFIMQLQKIALINVQNVNVPIQFLSKGKTADLASPEAKNGNQLSKPAAPQLQSVADIIKQAATNFIRLPAGG